MPGRVLTAAIAGGLAALVAVHLLLLHTYWDYSEGVYALSSRLILHGSDLYGQMVGAQPPGVFVTGVVLLAIHDSLEWLRFAVAVLQLGAGLIAAQIVYRVTGHRLAAILTPAAMLLTPWAVHEHGALTPELVALPVMLGATLLSVDRRRAGPAGVLCGVLVLIKLPLVIPALALVMIAPDRRGMAIWAAATLILGLAVTTTLGGSGFWRDVVIAQTHVGVRSLGLLKGFWAQAGWNVLGLLAAAVVAAAGRAGARDRPMLNASLALAVANVITFLTNFKVGTGLNVTVPVEASLVPLAAIGTVLAFRAARYRSGVPTPLAARGPALAGLCTVGAVFTLAQSVSLIASPHNPIPFLRAFSAPAWEISMTSGQLEAAVAAARACPPGAPYGSAPLIAMIAQRLPPAGQPDGFLPLHSSTLAAVAAQIRAARGVCG
ncbi:MAG: hypothetical protein ACRDNK_08215 [Solirubrobacteraceae bacterium]